MGESGEKFVGEKNARDVGHCLDRRQWCSTLVDIRYETLTL